MLAAGTDLSLALGAIPASMAAMYVGHLTYKATRSAVPAVKQAAVVEPRLAVIEDRQAGWIAALAAKDELIAQLRAELAECRGHPTPAP